MKIITNMVLVGATLGVLLGQAVAAAELTPAQEGRRLFMKLNCYGCHGINAGGSMGPSLRNGEGDDVAEAVLEGKEEGMPSFLNQVSATDIVNLTAYVQSLGSTDEPTFTHWWEDTPSQ